MEQSTEHNNTLSNWFLSLCFAFFAYVESLTFDDVYNFLFKVLTIISITLIVIINIPKAWSVLKSPFQKNEK